MEPSSLSGDFRSGDTSGVQKGQLEVTLSDVQGRTVNIAAKRLSSNEDPSGSAASDLGEVSMNITDKKTGENVRVEVKIQELADAIGVTPDTVEGEAVFGGLEAMVSDKLREGILEETSAQGEKGSIMTPEVRSGIVAHLEEYGLTPEKFERIEQFCTENRQELESLDQPTFIGRHEDPLLSRSLVRVPSGSMQGTYVLLKTHGGAEEIGIGAFNRATLCINLESGKKKIFRNARAEHVNEQELQANELAYDHPEHFAAGIVVKYRGAWRARGREQGMSKAEKAHIPRETNVAKTGMIMDLIEGGELFDRLNADPPLTLKEQVGIMHEYAEHMAVMHDELGLVHLDQKTENTFMTADGHPRVADFGYTVKEGHSVDWCGTPGMIAPEVVKLDEELGYVDEGYEYDADFPADVWSMGCVFADIMQTPWYEKNGQADDEWEKIFYKLDRIKDKCFSERSNPRHPHFVIDQCLQLQPGDRPSARAVADRLKEMYDSMPDDA